MTITSASPVKKDATVRIGYRLQATGYSQTKSEMRLL
jgi:hypothetical protein